MKPELLQTLFRSKTIKIERITSRGHVTPAGKWLRGRKNEWVMLLSGGAKLKFQKGRMVTMKAGGSVFIRAGRVHRVEWTRPGIKTVWLAVHFWRFMKKIKYSDEPMGRLRVVKDFLPPPDQIIFKEEPVKITMVMSKSSVQFFKKTARQHHTPYQKIIRTLLDTYVAQYTG